jgi:hypothetical protein
MVPFEPQARYKVDGAARFAQDCFAEAVRLAPDDVGPRWMLAIVSLALGEQPPRECGVPPFESKADIGRFKNVAYKAGITSTNLAGGAVMDDFDGDGFLDVVTSECNPSGRLHYWRNNGDGTFTDRAEAAGLGGQLGGLNLVHMDFDNDGRLDLFVLRGGWLQHDGRMRKSLLRNRGDGTFEDVTDAAGLGGAIFPSQTCAWADFDGDGDLDVFIGNESMEGRYPSQLFRNDGGTFSDVAREGGVTNDRYCKGCAAADFDNDGRMDLYVSNFGDANRLYRNLGGMKFEDVAERAGVAGPVSSFPTWFFDYDNDGNEDLFVAGYARDVRIVAADRMGMAHDGPRLVLYRNRGDGTFEDVTKAAGLYKTHLAMGCNTGDFDNDGWPDFFLGTGYPTFDAYEPNVAYRNAGGKAFEEITFSAVMGHLPKGHGVAFGDVDNDGDQDVFSEMGGFYPGDTFFNALFENPGHHRRWISLKLEGTKSPRCAIGARIAVTTAEGRVIRATVSTGSSFGGNSLQAEIGLGETAGKVAVEIRWPSGVVQKLPALETDAFYRVKESADTEREKRTRVKF